MRDAAAAKRERLSAQTFTTSAGGESTDPPQKKKKLQAPKQTMSGEFKHAPNTEFACEVRGQLLALVSSVFVSGWPPLPALSSFIPSAEMLSIPAVSRHRAQGLRPRGQAAGIIWRGEHRGGGGEKENQPPSAPRLSLLTNGFHKVVPAVASC